jgi:hypothetical protein
VLGRCVDREPPFLPGFDALFVSKEAKELLHKYRVLTAVRSKNKRRWFGVHMRGCLALRGQHRHALVDEGLRRSGRMSFREIHLVGGKPLEETSPGCGGRGLRLRSPPFPRVPLDRTQGGQRILLLFADHLARLIVRYGKATEEGRDVCGVKRVPQCLQARGAGGWSAPARRAC